METILLKTTDNKYLTVPAVSIVYTYFASCKQKELEHQATKRKYCQVETSSLWTKTRYRQNPGRQVAEPKRRTAKSNTKSANKNALQPRQVRVSSRQTKT